MLKERAAQFGLSGLEITEVDPDSIRITTPHCDDERFDRRAFWLWLFGELCGALHIVGDASCVFVLREQRQRLPPTGKERMKKFFHLPVPDRYAPATTRTIAVENLSLERRHRAVVRRGGISFLVSESEASRLQKLGVKVEEERCFGKREVVLSPLQMQSLTLPCAQALFLWLL
jgi:hypothetical protein